MWPALIGAGIGLMGSAISNTINSFNQDRANQLNADLQRDFAQNSVRWKVEDAKRAGINPLAALGAQTYNASPSYVASQHDSSGYQNASRLIADMQEKDQEAMKQQKIQTEILELERDKMQKELASMGQAEAFSRTPPATGFSNGSGATTTNGNTFNDSLNLGKGLKMVPLPNGNFSFSWDDQSVQGQAMQELGTYIPSRWELHKLAKDSKTMIAAEMQARKHGFLKDDETLDWSALPFSYELKPIKKSDLKTREEIDTAIEEQLIQMYGRNRYDALKRQHSEDFRSLLNEVRQQTYSRLEEELRRSAKDSDAPHLMERDADRYGRKADKAGRRVKVRPKGIYGIVFEVARRIIGF